MSSADKRLDLRFGAFACSVQGFDDPVPPVQQILRAIQHLLEESPELADTAINFDAEAIEQLVGEVARRSELDENDVEIVPGLIIIRHGAGGDLGAGQAAPAWSADVDPAASEEGGGDYVNIFAAPEGETGEAGEGAESEEEAAPEAAGEREDFADRLRRMATSDEYGWAEDEEETAEAATAEVTGVGAAWTESTGTESTGTESAGTESDEGDLHPDPWGEEDEDDGEEPLNLFAGGVAAEEKAGDNATVHNLFAAGTGGDQDAAAGAEPGESGDDASEPSAADLAERAGAGTVPELMVASAAWMVLTQGQTSFTRRDVLDVFETIPGDHENTPEARIKGFGKAVRNGQFVTQSDGIFGLARSELQRFQELL
jgi:hypothetical protein